MPEINYSKVTKKEITQLAKELAKANTLMWNAVMQAEDLTNESLIREYSEYEPEHQKFLKKLAIAFKKIKKNDDTFVDIETNGGEAFQNMDHFTSQLQEMLDKI